MQNTILPTWEYTNENLPAIITGLELKPEDIILSVCGSGDQAFAMLEHSKQVVAFDYNKLQIQFAIKRAEQLRKGDVDGFIQISENVNYKLGNIGMLRAFRSRNMYFTQDTVNIIKSKLNSIEFKLGNVFNAAEKKFTKVYLSNSLTYNSYDYVNSSNCPVKNENISIKRMKTLIDFLPQGALIYTASMKRKTSDIASKISQAFPRRLKIEKNLTTLAQEHETAWCPTVYKVKAKY
jgi:hypothetical protein